MKITLELPDWCDAKNLYILAGNELAAYREAHHTLWNVKTHRCNCCGRCCMLHPKEGSYFPLQENGFCSKLQKDGENYICIGGMEKPLACVIGEPVGEEHKKFECCIKYKKV